MWREYLTTAQLWRVACGLDSLSGLQEVSRRATLFTGETLLSVVCGASTWPGDISCIALMLSHIVLSGGRRSDVCVRYVYGRIDCCQAAFDSTSVLAITRLDRLD